MFPSETDPETELGSIYSTPNPKPTPWDETTAGIASAIRTIELTEKLAIIETILQLNLHNSWDRMHKALLLEACSQAYRTERTFVEVVANTHRGIKNGTETQANLESWTKSLVEAEENSRKVEEDVENLRALLWDVVFNEKKAVATLGEREWSEYQQEIIRRRRDAFERACHRIENLQEDIKDARLEEKRQAVQRGDSLLVTFNAPRSSFFPKVKKYGTSAQAISEATRKNKEVARMRSALNGTSLLNLEGLTPEQKRKYENFQELRLMVQRRGDERMQRCSQLYSPSELHIPFELSDSEDENNFDYLSSKRRRIKNLSIYEKVKKQLESTRKPIVHTAEEVRAFEGYDASPTDVISPNDYQVFVGEMSDAEANMNGRKEQRERTRAREEGRLANDENLKHK